MSWVFGLVALLGVGLAGYFCYRNNKHKQEDEGG